MWKIEVKARSKVTKGRDSKLQEVGPIPQVGRRNNALFFYDVRVQKPTSIETTVARKSEPVIGKVDTEV